MFFKKMTAVLLAMVLCLAPVLAVGELVYMEQANGSRGVAVLALQQRLSTLGYLYDDVDSIFGSKTTQAVMAFQTAAGLEVTGAADGPTQEALFALQIPGLPAVHMTALQVSGEAISGSALNNSGAELAGARFAVRPCEETETGWTPVQDAAAIALEAEGLKLGVAEISAAETFAGACESAAPAYMVALCEYTVSGGEAVAIPEAELYWQTFVKHGKSYEQYVEVIVPEEEAAEEESAD